MIFAPASVGDDIHSTICIYYWRTVKDVPDQVVPIRRPAIAHCKSVKGVQVTVSGYEKDFIIESEYGRYVDPVVCQIFPIQRRIAFKIGQGIAVSVATSKIYIPREIQGRRRNNGIVCIDDFVYGVNPFA